MTHKNHDKYDTLFELMHLWQEYEAGRPNQNGDLEQFSVWLNKRVSGTKRSEMVTAAPHSVLSTSPAERHTQQPFEATLNGVSEIQASEMMDFHRYIEPNVRISILLGRLSRFLTFYMKKVFAQSDIGSIMEFGILACVETLGTPKKIEVIHYNLIEKTTGTEMMKRLVKLGMLEEFDDTEDKRSKRVRITVKGTAFLESIRMELWQAGLIVTGNMPLEKQQELADMLDYLNNFHDAIYFNQHDASIEEIVEKNLLLPPMLMNPAWMGAAQFHTQPKVESIDAP